MQAAGLEIVEDCILNQQNMTTQYSVTRKMICLCEEALQRPGTWVFKRWWEHEGFELEGARVTEEAVAEGWGGEGGERGRGRGRGREIMRELNQED